MTIIGALPMQTSLKSKSNITLFTTCKPWRGADAIAQWNALQSWTHLQPRPDIVIFGDDFGSSHMAKKSGVMHRPDIERHRNGPPYLHALFRDAQAMAETSLVCYVNADIILARGLMEAADAAERHFVADSFMVVGRRNDVPALTDKALSFSEGWQARVEAYAKTTGQEHGPAGLDWFLFRRQTLKDLQPFIIGKSAWDNYLLLSAGRQGFQTVDATSVVLAIHQVESPQHPDALWVYNGGMWHQERPRHGEGTTDACQWIMSANLSITQLQGGNRYGTDTERRGRLGEPH